MDNSKFPSEAFFRKVSEENFKTIGQSFLSEMILNTIMDLIVKSKISKKNTNTAI
jgi:hypothetical protein